MKEVYISLGMFLLSAVTLCLWTKLGYNALVVAASMNDPGVGGAGFLFGALWGIAFSAIFRIFREVGKDVAAEIAKAGREG